MRNNLSSTLRFVKLGTGAVIMGSLLAVLMMAKSGAHEAHPSPAGIVVGEFEPTSAVCDARGASAVAKADIMADSPIAGNEIFTKLARADDPSCYAWGFKVPIEVVEIIYVGTSATNLHVYIIKLGEDMYVTVTIRREDLPKAGGTPEHGGSGYDYGKDSV